MAQFADLIHKYIERINISDSALAKKLGIKRETVFRWRTGKIKSPTCEKLEIAAKIFALNSIEYNEFLVAAGCPNQKFLQTSDVILHSYPIVNQFFGRKELLTKISSSWKNIPLQHVAIVGPKQSGKTSILNYIYDTQRLDVLQYMQQLKECQFIFIDFKNAQVHNPESFIRYLLKELHLSYDASNDLTELAEILNDNIDKPTVILMDDIEYGLKLPNLNEVFWGYLRSLGENVAHIGYCVTSRIPLLELEELADKIGKPSPLVNIFANEVELKAFTEIEARGFLKFSYLEDNDVEWILEQSQCWPVLLRILCKIRIEEEDNWQEIGLTKIQRYKHLLNKV